MVVTSAAQLPGRDSGIKHRACENFHVNKCARQAIAELGRQIVVGRVRCVHPGPRRRFMHSCLCPDADHAAMRQASAVLGNGDGGSPTNQGPPDSRSSLGCSCAARGGLRPCRGVYAARQAREGCQERHPVHQVPLRWSGPVRNHSRRVVALRRSRMSIGVAFVRLWRRMRTGKSRPCGNIGLARRCGRRSLHQVLLASFNTRPGTVRMFAAALGHCAGSSPGIT